MTGGFHTHFDIVGASETSNTAILRESWQESGQDCLWGMCMVPAGFCPKSYSGDEQQDTRSGPGPGRPTGKPQISLTDTCTLRRAALKTARFIVAARIWTGLLTEQ